MSYSPTTPTEYDKSSLEELGFFEHSIMHPEIASNSPDPICLDYPLGFELPSNRLPSSTSAAAVMLDDPTLSPNLHTPDSEVGLSPSLNATAHQTGGCGSVCGPAHSANINTSPAVQHQHQNSSHSSSSPVQLRNGQHHPSHHFSQHPSISDTQVAAPEWIQRASESLLLGRRGFTSQQSNSPTSTWNGWSSSGPGVQAMGSQWDAPSVLTGTNSGEGMGADSPQEQYKEQPDPQLRQIIDSFMHNHNPYADANSTSIQGHPQTYTLPQQRQSSATVKRGSHTPSLSHSTTPPTPPFDASPSLQDDNDSISTNVTNSFLSPFGLSQPAPNLYHHDASGGRVQVQIPNHVGTAQIYGASRPTDLQALLEQPKTLSPPLSFVLPGTTNRAYAGRHPRRRSQAGSARSNPATSPPSSRPTSFSSTGRVPDPTTPGGLGAPSPPFTGDGTMLPYDNYMSSSWPYEMPMPTQAYHDLGNMPLRSRSPTGPVAHISTSAHVSAAYQRYTSAMLGGITPSWASKQQADPVVSRSTVTRTSPQPPPSTVNRDNVARASDTANITARAGVIHRSTVTAARVVDGDKVVSLPSPVVEPTVPLEVRVEGLPRDKRAMFERACGTRWNAVRDATSSTRTIEDVNTLENNRILEAIYALLSSEALAKQMEIPDDLVEPLLARVPLPKTVAKRGSRGGAAGYTCLWAGCNKQLIKRLDHAKNHIREHCKSKPFACGGPTQGGIAGGRGCGQKFLRIDDLKRHQKSHCSVLKSGPARRPRAVRGAYHDEDDDEEHDSVDSPFKGDDDDEYRPTEPRLYALPTHAEPDASSPVATNDQIHTGKASTTRELVHRVRGEKQRAAAKQALAAVSAAAAYLVDEESSDGGRSSPDTMTSGTRASPVDLGRLQTSHVRGGATSTFPATLSSSSAAMLAANSRLLSPTYSTTQVATARDVHDGIRWDDLVEMDGGDMDVLGLDHQKVWLGCGALMASCSSRLISVPVRAATGCPHLLSLFTSFIFVVMFGILCRAHDVMEAGGGRRVGGIPECRTRARLRGEDRAVRRDRM